MLLVIVITIHTIFDVMKEHTFKKSDFGYIMGHNKQTSKNSELFKTFTNGYLVISFKKHLIETL